MGLGLGLGVGVGFGFRVGCRPRLGLSELRLELGAPLGVHARAATRLELELLAPRLQRALLVAQLGHARRSLLPLARAARLQRLQRAAAHRRKHLGLQQLLRREPPPLALSRVAAQLVERAHVLGQLLAHLAQEQGW